MFDPYPVYEILMSVVYLEYLADRTPKGARDIRGEPLNETWRKATSIEITAIINIVGQV